VDDGGKFRFKDSMNRDAPVEPSREELIALIAAQAAEIAALRLILPNSNAGLD